MSLPACPDPTSAASHGKPPRPKVRRRQPRCDCGQPATVVISVHVGCDPQYTVQLPLCPACLELERELHA